MGFLVILVVRSDPNGKLVDTFALLSCRQWGSGSSVSRAKTDHAAQSQRSSVARRQGRTQRWHHAVLVRDYLRVRVRRSRRRQASRLRARRSLCVLSILYASRQRKKHSYTARLSLHLFWR